MNARWLALLLLVGCGSDPAEVSHPAGSGGAVSSWGGAGGDTTDAGSGGSTSQGGSAGQTSSGGAAGAAGQGGAAGSSGSAGTAGAAGAQCTDSYPYADGYSCAQQAAWGKCGETWLKDDCDLSCGRCGGGPDCASIGPDPCPMSTGIAHACRKRFALGVNYAWHAFAGDFGGIPQWNQSSISQSPATYDADLALMRANGASVVRWWVFPDFRGAGVSFDSNGDPTGISDTASADVEKALELAAKNDLYLVLTIFSFDNFRPDHESYGVVIRGMQPLVSDPSRRANLIEKVVRPLARSAAQSPHLSRLLGWDLVNEPEWAIAPSGSAPIGLNFSPMDELSPVSLQDMKSLFSDMSTVLAAETPSALRSVGWAAAKWSWAFQDVAGLDFQQPHIYGWVNDWWPYTSTPAQLGYAGKPTVIGECYLQNDPFSNGTSFPTVANSLFANGYAGFWPWDFYSGNVKDPADPSFDLNLIKSFADEKGCQATFVPNPPPPPPPQKVAAAAPPLSNEADLKHWQTLQHLRVTDKKRALAHALRGTSTGRSGEAREAMIVTLLVELDRMPEARERTRRFLAEHPESSYRTLVQGMTGIHPRPGKVRQAR